MATRSRPSLTSFSSAEVSASLDCLTIFQAAPEDKTRADHIDARAPEKACEFKVVSEHCSQSVEDEETLVRIVIDDTHVVRDGNVVRLKSVFMNDACTFGSSSLRLGRATKEEIQLTLDEMLNDNTPLKQDGSPRTLIGYVKIPVRVVRDSEITQEVKDDAGTKTSVTGKPFAVYATGLEKRPNHADVFCVATYQNTGLTKSARNRAAANLTGKFASGFVETTAVEDILSLGSFTPPEVRD